MNVISCQHFKAKSINVSLVRQPPPPRKTQNLLLTLIKFSHTVENILDEG